MDTHRGVYRSAGSLRAERERSLRRRYGGLSLGAGFVGFVVAAVLGALLLGLLGLVSQAAGYGSPVVRLPGGGLSLQVPSGMEVGWSVMALLCLFVAYLVGGYAAGRMARFDGALNGSLVVLWTLLVVGVLAAAAAASGTIRAAMTGAAPIALAAALLVALLGSVLGGQAGAASHRRIDAELQGDLVAGVLEGAPVLDRRQRRTGTVLQSYVDSAGHPEFIAVRLTGWRARTRILPLEGSEVANGRLYVPYTKEEILDAPAARAVGDTLPSSLREASIGYYRALEHRTVGGVPPAPTPAAAPAHTLPSDRAEVREVPAASEPLPVVESVRDRGDVVEVPIVEEELVKRPVVKEVLRVQKHSEPEVHRVETDLRKEDVEVRREGDVRPPRES